MNPRLAAAHCIHQVIVDGRSLTAAQAEWERKIDFDQQPLFRQITIGCCRHYFWLNAAAKISLLKSFKEKDQILHSLLLVGIYQLIYLQVADHAAINETVEQCRVLDRSWAVKVLNGVLRNLQRNQDQVKQDLEGSPVTQFNHPKWLIKRLSKVYPDHWQQICEANNEQPPLTLRVNSKESQREPFFEQLKEMGLHPTLTQNSQDGIRIDSCAVVELPGFAEGRFSVQDEAAQLAAQILSPIKNDRVLDACCAPGGKTCHLLELSPEIHVTALDADESRMTRVEENLSRLNLSAELKVAEAQNLDQWWDQIPFDRVLLDVPCSATGVIRRHPDIKLLRTKEDIAKLVVLQQQILEQIWKTLAVGGHLLYATCSVLPEENAEQIKLFLENTPGAELIPLEQEWGMDTGFGRQLLPNKSGHDGFFYAYLKKVS